MSIRFTLFVVCILSGLYLLDSYMPLKTSTADICYNHEWNEFSTLDMESVVLLAKVINSESHGESFTDKLLVGSVVLNRMESQSFPETMWGVVYQPFQFSGIRSKYFRFTNKTKYDVQSILAAQMLLRHGSFDKTIMYFLNPKISSNKKWVKHLVSSHKLVIRGKQHHFYM